MENKTARLYFIDAMRAWAILMMLQGHFIDGLLDPVYRDGSNTAFSIWKYFRGITAPLFFTVSGFIFTYLLIKGDKTGLQNPRVKKGIKRGLELLFIGYLLRTNLLGLLQGKIYDSFYLIDVLHCIGLSLLGIIGIYLFTEKRKKFVFPTILLSATLVLFIFEPTYKTWEFSFLPDAFANYLTKSNGSVFTILPWFGYASFGAFLSVVFTKFKNLKYLYFIAIPLFAATGATLIAYSSDLFLLASKHTGLQLFANIYFNNYLFIRLGDVLLVFSVFMLFRSLLRNKSILKIGQSTLSIYIIHFIILYGTFTGLGLYRFLHHSLSPVTVILGALTFMVVCTYSALVYEENKEHIKLRITTALRFVLTKIEITSIYIFQLSKSRFFRFLRRVGLAKN